MPVTPKTQPVFLPPSHPFAKLSTKAFENLFGVHAYLVVARPIPIGTEQPR
jgi:hypothetical protein